MAILEIKNVSKFFGGLAANSNVSFSVEEGSFNASWPSMIATGSAPHMPMRQP